MFADDTSLFSSTTSTTTNQINNDLHDINTWAHQWKMNFNSDTSKQVQETILSRKVKVTPRPQLVFNNNPVHENSS